MRVHARLLATAALCFALSIAAPAQQPQSPPPQTPPSQQPPAQPPAGQRPVIRSGVNFVSVDVIVTDKKTGEVVLDMAQDDFEVREDKKPQKVDTFDLIKIDALSAPSAPREIRSTFDEESEARQPNVRLFILLLDDYHVRRGSARAARKPLMDFVTNQLAPQDMVAVIDPLTPATAVTFTGHRSSFVEAI